MTEQNLSKKIISGMGWKAFERIFLQIINAATPIILLRKLTPEDYGLVAILTVFTSLANTFVHNGLGNAIIQKKDSDDIDASTVFYLQLGIAFICYFVLWFSAPFISKFYNNENLTLMLRVMSLSLVIGALGTMQVVMLKKEMLFNRSFVSSTVSTIAQGIVGISCAYAGYGAWSLIWASISKSIALNITNIFMIRWYPKLVFSLSRLKTLFSYSWKLTVGWFIGTLHQDIYTLIIGKRFSSAVLGYYRQALTLPDMILKTVTEVVDGVMFPALSKIQNERERLLSMTRKLISVNSFVIFPVFFGLSAVSKQVTIFLVTEKWLPAVPMMQIVCITLALNALNSSNMQVFNSMGRSDIFMKFEIIKRSISIVLLIGASFISIYAVIIVLLLMAVISNCLNAYQNNKLLGYKYSQFLSDALVPFVCALIMAVITYFVGVFMENMGIHNVLILVVKVLTGVIVYLLVTVIFKVNTLKDIIFIVKNTVRKK